MCIERAYDIYLVIILSGGMRTFNQITSDESKVADIHMNSNQCPAIISVSRMTLEVATDQKEKIYSFS